MKNETPGRRFRHSWQETETLPTGASKESEMYVNGLLTHKTHEHKDTSNMIKTQGDAIMSQKFPGKHQ